MVNRLLRKSYTMRLTLVVSLCSRATQQIAWLGCRCLVYCLSTGLNKYLAPPTEMLGILSRRDQFIAVPCTATQKRLSVSSSSQRRIRWKLPNANLLAFNPSPNFHTPHLPKLGPENRRTRRDRPCGISMARWALLGHCAVLPATAHTKPSRTWEHAIGEPSVSRFLAVLGNSRTFV